MQFNKTKEIVVGLHEAASQIHKSGMAADRSVSDFEMTCHAVGCNNRPAQKLQLLVKGRTILLSLCSTCLPRFVPNSAALSCSTTPISTQHEVTQKEDTK